MTSLWKASFVFGSSLLSGDRPDISYCFLRNVDVAGSLWCSNWKKKLTGCIFLLLKSFLSLRNQIIGVVAKLPVERQVDVGRTLV